MTITTDLDQLWTEKKQRDATVEAKAQMQNAMFVIKETESRIQAIIDQGVFNTIPVSVRNALQKAFQVIKTASTGFNDAEVKEVLNWKGK